MSPTQQRGVAALLYDTVAVSKDVRISEFWVRLRKPKPACVRVRSVSNSDNV